MYIKATFFVYFAFLCSTALSDGPVGGCPCKNKQHCEPVSDWKVGMREMMVITNRSSDYKLWLWDSLTTVLEWNDDLDSNLTNDLMCYAHSKGKKYGFYVKEFPKFEHADLVANEVSYKRADVVAMNLVDYLGDCSYSVDHVPEIISNTTAVFKFLKKHITPAKLLCVMPWKPPCFEQNCDISQALAKQCDAVIFSPESYNTYCSETCTAKATVSISKINIGITEYLASGFTTSQLLLGIPWHGYNYTCQIGDHKDDWTGYFVCHLKTKKDNVTGKDVCDIDGSRVKLTIGSTVGDVPEMALLDATFSQVDKTPFIVNNTKSGNVIQSYMTWYEDIGSLLAKYDAVGQFNLKGCVIYSGDDLTYDHVKTNNQFDNHMWSWMLHSILSSGNAVKPEKKGNIAGTVAGVGVGMFLLGCLLGTLISCIIFRRKKTLHAPFKHDAMTDEYTDDDHNQL